MGDTDGSSSAAQSAQSEDQTASEAESSKGLWGRIFDVFGGPSGEFDADGMDPGDLAKGAPIGLLNLTRMRVEDVMLPKVEIVAVANDISSDALVEVFRESGLTRLPVFDGTLDTPLGMVHLKDIALRHGFDKSLDDLDLSGMLRPLLYAPPSMPIGVLLQKMQTDRVHMALVIDEYGGVDGLVTIEDLIEQVIGEIEDEHDIDEGSFWVEEAPGCYLAQSRTPLDEFEDEIGQKLIQGEDEEEIDTLGGLVFMLAGRVPTRGEVVRHPDGLDFEVVDADPRRIKRLRVRVGARAARAAE